METCVLMPADLGLMLQPHPTRLLEMRVGIWSCRELQEGLQFEAEEGELHLEKLEVYKALDEEDVSFLDVFKKMAFLEDFCL